MATLVRIRGSSPRQPGARLCVTRSGQMAGSVSGGCVENDVFEQAVQVLDGGEPVLASYGIDDELSLEVGLSCGGAIDVLIEPFAASEAWQAVEAAVGDEKPAALATAIGPGPLAGRKLAVLDSGETVGSIDAAVDGELADEARRILLSQTSTRVLTVPWNGQEVGVFIEAFAPPQRLFIVGATHTAMSLCRMAKELGFHVVLIDPRQPFVTAERFPEADELRCGWPGEVLDENTLDAYSYVVTLSHDPKFDIPTLTTALRCEARYIGAMGSRKTHERRKRQLRETGFSDEEIARICAPIGLDIGGRSPEEIAVAILAEMLAVRYGKIGVAPGDGNPASDGGA